VLETERLTLRELTPADADDLVALDADVEVMKYVETPSRVDRAGCLAVIEKATGEFLGWVELTPDGWLGYRLHRKAWGRGHATEACRALVEEAFTEHRLKVVRATTMTVNTRSRSVMRKCGLRYRRTFWAQWPEYIEGAEFGDVEYELWRIEWRHHSQVTGDS
jgi:RimJ/RimL family protein N-acetyltransferase